MVIDTFEAYLAADMDGEINLHLFAKPGLLRCGLFSSYECRADCIGPLEKDPLPRLEPGQLVRVKLHIEVAGDVQLGEQLQSPSEAT